MFENPRTRQASKKFYNKCSENSGSEIVFRTDILRKLTLEGIRFLPCNRPINYSKESDIIWCFASRKNKANRGKSETYRQARLCRYVQRMLWMVKAWLLFFKLEGSLYARLLQTKLQPVCPYWSRIHRYFHSFMQQLHKSNRLFCC